jgi:hypothetical protein
MRFTSSGVTLAAYLLLWGLPYLTFPIWWEILHVSGVVNVDTRGGTDDWKWLFEDPIPRFRWINHRQTHGVESASPHLTFAGPLVVGKAWIFETMGYGYDTVTVPSLPNPNNVRIVEKINTYSQLDWNASASHRFTAVFALDPQNTSYANIYRHKRANLLSRNTKPDSPMRPSTFLGDRNGG